MLRCITGAVAATLLAALSGCDQLGPPAAGPTPTPPAPVTPGTPPTPAPPMLMPSGAATPTGLTLQAARDARGAAAAQLTAILDSAKDDASAAAAAQQLPAASQAYAASVKTFNATMAAVSLSGGDDQIEAFMQQQADRPQPEMELIEKIKTTVNGPYGPTLQPAINGLFDAWLAAGSTGEKRSIQHLIEKEKLRR